MLILCLVLGFVLTTGVGLLVKQNVELNRKLDIYSSAFTQFFTEADGDKGTPFYQAVDQFGDILSQKMGVTVQASIRGAMGGTQRAINQGLEEVAVSENPALGLLPRSLHKNGLAMMGIQALMQNFMKQRSGGDNGSKETEQARFRL